MSIALPYTVKRFVAQFLMPMPLVVEVFVLGWLLSRLTRFKRTGTGLKVLAGCLFLAFSYGFGSGHLSRIERKHPIFDPTPAQCEQLSGCDVLVLGQGMVLASALPLRFRVNGTFYMRLLEGVRVGRLLPDSRILVSMAGDAPLEDKHRFVREFAETVGVPACRFLVLDGARDTAEEVQMALDVARPHALVVATSASHMPRALQIIRDTGVTAVSAPCDFTHTSRDAPEFSLRNLPLPSGHGFELSKRAAHEWLGSIYEAQRH